MFCGMYRGTALPSDSCCVINLSMLLHSDIILMWKGCAVSLIAHHSYVVRRGVGNGTMMVLQSDTNLCVIPTRKNSAH